MQKEKLDIIPRAGKAEEIRIIQEAATLEVANMKSDSLHKSQELTAAHARIAELEARNAALEEDNKREKLSEDLNKNKDQSSNGIKKSKRQFCAKQISISEECKEDVQTIIETKYNQYHLPEIGSLLLNKKTSSRTYWRSETKASYPKLQQSLKFPPILMPSSGRPKSALLDLRDAMEGDDYVQIVLIRDEEKEQYLEVCQSHSNIDILILPEGSLQTVGTARFYAKRLGEMITAELKSRFMFLLDDNIVSWSGVTLKNDPYPLFDKEPNHKFAQQTDISLRKLLEHFTSKHFERVSHFSILGFSLTRRKIRSRVQAYSREHVFAAVLLNLQKLETPMYKMHAWAMEDIDFNWQTDQSEGVIVKCLRFVGNKKRITQGGVLPKDFPEDIENKLKNCQEWNLKESRNGFGRKIKKANGPQETIQEDFEDFSKESKHIENKSIEPTEMEAKHYAELKEKDAKIKEMEAMLKERDAKHQAELKERDAKIEEFIEKEKERKQKKRRKKDLAMTKKKYKTEKMCVLFPDSESTDSD